MNDPQSQFDREAAYLGDQHNRGEITLKEYNDAMRNLQREYRDAAQDAAMEAYQNEMDNW